MPTVESSCAHGQTRVAIHGGNVTMVTPEYDLALTQGQVILQGRVLWHSKGATFILRLPPPPFGWFRRLRPPLTLRELPAEG
jgi:hypothetical protein